MTIVAETNEQVNRWWGQGTKFPKFQTKFRSSVEINKISPLKFRFYQFFPCFFFLFFGSKNLKKMLLEGFEPTQNA